MDAILPALFSSAPQLGVAGILLIVLGLLMRREASDRTDYRAALESAAKRHSEEIARITTGHDTEIAELKSDIKGLEQKLADLEAGRDRKVADLEALVDLEREARRRAEDMAAEARRNPPGWSS